MVDRFWHADLVQGDLSLRLAELVGILWSGDPGPFRFVERTGSVTLDRTGTARAADLGDLDDCVRIRLFAPEGDVHARRLDWSPEGRAWRLRVVAPIDLSGLEWLSRFTGHAITVEEGAIRLASFGRRLTGMTGWYEGKLPREIIYPVATDAERVVLEARRCLDAAGGTMDWRFVRLAGIPREVG